MRILRLTSLFTLIFVGKISLCQIPFPSNDLSLEKTFLPDRIRRITQYTDNQLTCIWEYDTLKNLTFNYSNRIQNIGESWKGKSITIITCNLYGNDGKLTKSYFLHSNVGLSILYYVYDSLGNNVKLLVKDNSCENPDSLSNINKFDFISEIKSTIELLKQPKIIDIETKSIKYLQWEGVYDSLRNLTQEITYISSGDTSSYKKFKYDKNNNQVYFYNKWSVQNQWEYYYTYRQNPFFLYAKTPSRKKEVLLQSVRIDYDWNEKTKKISDVMHYKYDDKERLIEDLEYNQGEFQSKYLYQYNNRGKLRKRISYVYDELKIACEETYEYNKEGDLIKEIDIDHRTGKKEIINYRYTYEYYN